MITAGYARCCKALFVGWKIWFLRDHVHQRILALASIVFKEKKKNKHFTLLSGQCHLDFTVFSIPWG